MKKIYALLFTLLISFNLVYSSDIRHSEDRLNKRFIIDNKTKPDEFLQQQLRTTPEWNTFLNQNGSWWVQFNETNKKPHRAFGTPISLPITSSPEAASLYFLKNHTAAYLKNTIDLRPTIKPTVNEKYFQANFIQYYNNLEILWSRATVKLTHDYKAVMFGLDVYDDINISTTPQISQQSAIQFASADILNPITNISVTNDLKILPIPNKTNNTYKLVYELIVESKDDQGIPSKYYTLVDANDGTIIYRQNKVEYLGNTASADITVKGTIYPTHPYNASAVYNLPYVKVNTGTGINFTDVNGLLNVTNATPFNATISLEGPWAQVFEGVSGSVVPSLNATINSGANTIDMDPNCNIQQLSAYYHTNIIHDFMKTKLTSFVDLDFPMVVRVNRNDGTCNAFYDGDLNFYTTAGGCNALSEVNDVVYHEYGHGISNVYWNSNGLNFSNGGMGEGYSDVWAICITNNPVLGIGFSSTDPNTNVRNYDFVNGVSRKVYPQNITGEVHADGEIIAGAWCSTALNLGSISQMSDIFAGSIAGLANGPDGSEGQVYTDILIDALLFDDNDANLTNGTPNSASIVPAFASHGITLLSNANLTHTPITTSLNNTPITLNASLTNVQFAWALAGVKGAYKLNNASTWTPISFTNSSGTNYTASIPGQPNGSVIAYYVGIEDINGTLSNVMPAGASAANPNLPYFIMVGYSKILTEDFDFSSAGGVWTEGLPGDNATTGLWELNSPVQTNVNGSIVQTNTQVTPGGVLCYVTGASDLGSVGGNDIDGGRTSLESPNFDLTGYLNPAIEYFRWYTNDQGATPGTDFIQVLASEDGVNYINIENTNVADHSWRRNIFRVKDYFPTATNITMRFIAEDANAGSLVEALLDDWSIYDEVLSGLNQNNEITAVSLFPNPSNDHLNVNFLLNQSGNFDVSIVNLLGEKLVSENFKLSSGSQQIQMETSKLPSGIYQLNIASKLQQKNIKFSVIH